MKKSYTNHGSYAASCVFSREKGHCDCCTQCDDDCQHMISNRITIEGEYLPEKIIVCDMEYVAVS